MVSIHARFISRAIPGQVGGGTLGLCFNPRPVYKPGDTPIDHERLVRGVVSIHARFISRAILMTAHRGMVKVASFNPRPVYKPGDTLASLANRAQGMFQSTPGL